MPFTPHLRTQRPSCPGVPPVPVSLPSRRLRPLRSGLLRQTPRCFLALPAAAVQWAGGNFLQSFAAQCDDGKSICGSVANTADGHGLSEAQPEHQPKTISSHLQLHHQAPTLISDIRLWWRVMNMNMKLKNNIFLLIRKMKFPTSSFIRVQDAVESSNNVTQ